MQGASGAGGVLTGSCPSTWSPWPTPRLLGRAQSCPTGKKSVAWLAGQEVDEPLEATQAGTQW